MTEEEIVFSTCNEIYSSNAIKTGMCLHITTILVKYFQAKSIETKPHLAVLFNSNTLLKAVPHNWISYSGKKCDITADKQLDGFKTQVIILDKIISDEYNDAEIISFAQADLAPNLEDIVGKLKSDMICEASKSEDLSFSHLLVDTYIEEQNDEFQSSIKALNLDSEVSDIIELISKEGKRF